MTTNLGGALRRRDFLVSQWPWRAVAYLLSTALVAALPALGLLIVAAPLMATVNAARRGNTVGTGLIVFLTVTAVLLLALAPFVSVPVAALERRRLALVDPRPLTPRPGGSRLIRFRAVAYLFLLAGVVPVVYWLLLLVTLIDVLMIASPWMVNHGNPIVVVWTTVDSAQQAVPFAIGAAVGLPVLAYLFGALAWGQAWLARRLLDGRFVVTR